MIDLDAIKAAGLSSDATSLRLLAAHHTRERNELHHELWCKWLRDHPDASTDECSVARQAIEEAS